ncbi:Peroxidase [Mycena chlorophos]|uniref:Peroxidase n=1 Tax=Mycena chlorophos TaxID=658473 RepID=A0A8H6TI96_MYCCL|nr:Peroxidase [Mycena chlorophos]
MLRLTFGAEFLLRLAFHVVSKPVLLGVVLHYGSRRLEWPLPIWLSVFLAAAIVPVYFAVNNWLTVRRHEREAKAMGARLAPSPQGKWPGNVDLLRTMLRNSRDGYPGETIARFMAELGPVINIRILWGNAIVTTHPEHIKRILSTEFNNYEKGPDFRKTMNPVLGSGVFNSDGKMWTYHRSMTRPFFTKDRISHFASLDAHASLVISALKTRTRAGHAVDFQDLIGRFTMDSATEMLFGKCVDSLKGSIPYAHNAGISHAEARAKSKENEFITAFSRALEAVAARDRRGVLAPLYEIWTDATHEPMKVVNAFLAGEKREAQTLLDELLDSTSDGTILKDEVLNILIAGRDTTMHTLTMVIYFLSVYPAVAQRLRAEVLAQIGSSRAPTFENIKEMKYLRAVINEALRLYPPVPFNLRASVQSTTWPSPDPNEKPIYVPAGTQTPYAIFIMQRRKDLWGPDADEFDPDRFLDERLKQYLLHNPFAFLPFNAGPRICLGQQFAYNEMSFVLVRLLQAFSSFELDEEACPPASRPPKAWRGAQGRKGVERFRPAAHLTMSTMGGLWVRATEAEEM